MVSRLKRKLLRKSYTSRLKRKIIAEWIQQDLYDPDLMNKINDAMINQVPVQINYEGSGYREMIPYSWYTSKDGNVMIQCYRTDTNELRRYRFDRIDEIYLNDDYVNGYDETSQQYNNENWNAEEVGNEMEDIFEQNSEEVDMSDYMYDDENLNGETEDNQQEEVYDTNVFDGQNLNNEDQNNNVENEDQNNNLESGDSDGQQV